MKKTSLVIDASIAVKWFSEEEGSREARVILESAQSVERTIYVPQIFFFELTNALSYRMPLSEEELSEALVTVFALGLRTEVVTEVLLKESSYFSRKLRISVYDAAYIALAQLLNLPFITADRKLKERVNLPRVKLL